jgi:putative sigma-54 modulation protein
MNVEYTGRQVEITPALRKQVERGLKKLTKIIGDNFESKVVLTLEKHRNVADVTITSPSRNPVVGLAEARDMTSAIDGALERIERQLLKNKARWRNLKRQPRDKTWNGEEKTEAMRLAIGVSATAAVPVAVHSFPARAHTQEAHIIKTSEAVALRPMTVEEAVKEAEFRDQHVFVFRDKAGDIKVIHRRLDGKIELIDVPSSGGTRR